MSKLSQINVNVLDNKKNKLVATLKEAELAEIQSLGSDWTCNWQKFWDDADFNCEAIVKLTFRQNILGLIHFALYPYPYPNNSPEYLEIIHIECLNKNKRLVNPVGFWLIWYATKIALEFCQGDEDENILLLVALEEAFDYYKDKVMMEYIKPVTISPDEDGYAFKFTSKSASDFCTRVEGQYGIAKSE